MIVSTFNLENLDEGNQPLLKKRIDVLRLHLSRLNADILCLQEVHGQEREGHLRDILTLKELIKQTPYQNYSIVHTKTSNQEAYDKRNLVILSKHEIVDHSQIKNEYVKDFVYRPVTAIPQEDLPKDVNWERPALYAKVQTDIGLIHIINVHLKSRIPTEINGQKKDNWTYNTVNGWAEGYFISSMKRVGQALEVRFIIDKIFDEDADAKIIVCGDFNAEPENVPVETIIGSVENTGNPDIGYRQIIPCSRSIPKGSRFTHIHQGQKNLIDHILISRALLPHYMTSEIHNETLHDETVAFRDDKKYPESDHAPFISKFCF